MGWFFTITEEMRALGLKGSDLIVFAIIHNFSQKQLGYYVGGNEGLAEMAGMSVRSTQRSLHRLVESGFIKSEEVTNRGKVMIAYSSGDKLSFQGAKNCHPKGCNIVIPRGDSLTPKSNIVKTDTSYPKKENTSTTFTPPTIEQVYDYVKDMGMKDPEGFARYYVNEQTERGWTRKDGGKSLPVKDWKNNVRQWMPNHMNHTFPKQVSQSHAKAPVSAQEYLNK